MRSARPTTKAEVERQKRESLNRLATVLAVLGLTAAVFTGFATFTAISQKEFAKFGGAPRLQQAEKLAAENAAIKVQLAALTREVATLRPTAGASPTSAEMAKINEGVSELATRQKRIEDAISSDPARALEVPLLRRDVDNLKESQAQAIASIGQRLDQIFDLNKWLLGGGALSLISIALSTLLSRWKVRVEP